MIYFMQAVSGGFIKIGYTDNLTARHRELERYYRCKLSVLATLDGGKAEEFAIHRRFRAYRHGRTEQFQPSPEIMEFIGLPLLAPALDHEASEPLGGTRTVIFKLPLEAHRELRIAAAKANLPIAVFARSILREFLSSTTAPGR